MNVKDFQKGANKLVSEIDKKLKIKHDKKITIVHIYEELGEISRQVYNDFSGRDKPDIENLKEEFADVYMMLARLASLYNIDLEEAIRLKIKTLKKKHNLK